MTQLSQSDRAILNRQIKRASGMTYLACRRGADNHRWVRCQPDFTPDYGVPAVWQCEVCDTIKRQVHTNQGELLGSDYEYPDGYLYHAKESDSTMERMFTPQAIRAAYHKRIMESVDELPTVRPLPEGGGST